MESRSLVFAGGTSDKFWAIRVDGATHTVRYGRSGTAGQTKTKTFADEAAAAVAAERLVAEKLRKGYVDGGTPGGVAGSEDAPAPPDPAPALAAAPAGDGPPARPATPVPVDDDRPAVDLTPAEWSIATWRPLPGPPTGEPRPFDARALREDLRLGNAEWGWWRWRASPIRVPMGREEASYWLRATQRVPYGTTVAQRHAEVVALGDTLDERAALRLAVRSGLPDGEAMAPLVTLLGATRVAEILVDDRLLTRRDRDEHRGLRGGARLHLLPLLSPEQRASLASTVRDRVRDVLRRDPGYVVGEEAILAADLGLHDEVEEICARWADRWFQGDGSDSYDAIALGLGSPERLEEVVARTRLGFRGERAVAGWLAHTELRRLDVLVDAGLRADSKDAAAEVVGPLAARVHAAEAAPAMLRLLRDSRAPEIARAWLDDHPAQAVSGLVPLLAGGGALAEAAGDELRRTARGPRRAVVDAVAERLDPADRARLTTRVLDAVAPPAPPLAEPPAWLSDAAARLGRAKLPAWLDPSTLPPLVIGGGTLGPQDLGVALRILRATTPDAQDPATAELRAAADPLVAEELSWALFDAWLLAGAPARDKWALLQLGVLGGDGCAGRLAPLVRAWPGQSQHARAVLGLAVLRAIGTDAALMHLNGIAQKLKFKGLKAKAQEAMEAIARDKGMSRGELEDRIVPDCGLDERGSRTFDYGPRSFTFVLGPGMKPMVRDGAGKLRAAPPKPGAKDDPERAPAALAEWKIVRKTVGDVAKIQGARLEQAMVGGRRWTGADFDALLARHPLQRHLVRLLVMGVYEDGAVRATFRLTEEGDLSDADDEPFALAPDAVVGIVHPLELDPPVAAAWGELLADYEVVPPFAQLGRTVLDVLPAERDARELTRFHEHRIPPGPLVRILEAAEWERGSPQDGGVYVLHAKHFAGADCTAVVEYEDGLWAGYVTEAGPQRLTHVYVLPGHVRGDQLGYGVRYDDAASRRLRWRDVPPIVRSEILGDVQRLVAKAEA